MGDFQSINSSNLEAAGYDEATQTLTVKFRNGTSYRYANVLPELFAAFSALFSGEKGSAGKFFNQRIRSLPCEKVEENDDDEA